MNRPLFDVTIAVSIADFPSGAAIYDVTVVDRYHKVSEVVDQAHGLHSLDESIEFAKGVVTDFLRATSVDE